MALFNEKKRGFLADPKFLAYKGFTAADESDNGIQLWYLPFAEDAPKPAFRECAKHPHVDESGFVLYYTNQCPFPAKYVPVIEAIAAEEGVAFRSVHITDKETARNAPTPVTNYALFKDGEYITNEVLSDKKFLKMISG